MAMRALCSRAHGAVPTRWTRFINGRDLLDLLKRLVTDYRSKLMSGGDNHARRVFGKNEYAAKESETVMTNKASAAAENLRL